MAEKEPFLLKGLAPNDDISNSAESSSDHASTDDYAAFMLDMLPEHPAEIIDLQPAQLEETEDTHVSITSEARSSFEDSAEENPQILHQQYDEHYLHEDGYIPSEEDIHNNLHKIDQPEADDNIAETTREWNASDLTEQYATQVEPGAVFSYKFPTAPLTGVRARISAKTRACAVDITPRYTRICSILKRNNPTRVFTQEAQDTPLMIDEYEHDNITSWEELRDNKDKSIASTKEIIKKHKLTGSYANIALPMSAAILHTMPMANISTTELESMITENENFWYPILGEQRNAEDYTITYEVVLRDQATDTMYLNVAAYHTEQCAFFTNFIEECGLKPASVEIRETALLRAFAQAVGDTDTCVAVLQIGSEENHFLMTYNGLITAKEIIINDWDKVALVNGDDQLLQSLTSRYAEEILNTMTLFQADCNAPPPERIGLASYIPLAPVFIESLSQAVPEASFITLVRDVDDKANFTMTEMYVEDESKRHLYDKPLASDACVVAMAGRYPVCAPEGQLTPEGLNLYPGKTALAKALVQRYIGRNIAIALAIIVCIFSMFITTLTTKKHSHLKGIVAEMKQKSSDYTNVIHEAKGLKSFTDMLKEMEVLPSKLPLNQELVMNAMKRVHSTIPEGVWLDAFDFVYPNRISMSGRALKDREILDFMNQLSAGSVFTAVTLKMMEAREEDGIIIENIDTGSAQKQKRLIKSFRIDATLPAVTKVVIE